MANKYMKRWSTLLAIRGMQKKAKHKEDTISYLHGMAIIQEMDSNVIWELSYAADENDSSAAEAIPFLGSTQETRSVQTKTCTWMFITASVIWLSKSGNYPHSCQLMNG